MTMQIAADGGPKTSWRYDPKIRGYFFQALLTAIILFLVYGAVSNAVQNMPAHHIRTDFGFLNDPAGFNITQSLIPYSPAQSTYGTVFVVGLLNTLLVSVIGIVFATVIGFFVGIARLSPNFIVARIATAYVETFRNIPLLVQLLFWYNGVLKALPDTRQSIVVGNVFLNNRGLIMPEPVFAGGALWVGVALVLAIAVAWVYHGRAKRLQRETGKQSPVLLVTLGLVILLPLVAYFAAGRPITFDVPQLRGFNFDGGVRVYPEFVAMLAGLSVYTASFIAEIVRAGILSVSRGQTEAAAALGLRPGRTMRLIVIPQALRLILPPLTSQYLNLVKNSSLAALIGYPEIVTVFAGTAANQSSAPVQTIVMTMAFYLVVSLVISGGVNLYNRRIALVER